MRTRSSDKKVPLVLKENGRQIVMEINIKVTVKFAKICLKVKHLSNLCSSKDDPSLFEL